MYDMNGVSAWAEWELRRYDNRDGGLDPRQSYGIK